jgi:hypothetical protein
VSKVHGKGGPPHPLTAAVKKGGPDARRARVIVMHAIEQCDGKPEAAASMVGVSNATFYRLLERLDLTLYATEVRVTARKRERAEKNEKKTSRNLRDFIGKWQRRAASRDFFVERFLRQDVKQAA